MSQMQKGTQNPGGDERETETERGSEEGSKGGREKNNWRHKKGRGERPYGLLERVLGFERMESHG